jgi:hypothetical protein
MPEVARLVRRLASRPGAPGASRLLGVLAGVSIALALAACGATDRAAPAGSAVAKGSPGGVGSSPAAGRTPVAGTSAASGPPRFWSGTDTFAMPVTGTGPYAEPVIGGGYGGYIGMAGNWAHWQGCGGGLVWSAANASQAAANLARNQVGIGAADFWFMAGPGTDPRYNGTVAEATAWGERQAARALADIGAAPRYPVLWMDVELPGSAPQFTPAPDNGWKAV